MIKVNKDNIAQIAAVDYKKQYCVDGVWYVLLDGIKTKDIYNMLKKTKTAEEAESITNWSWVNISCDVCDEIVDEVIRFPFGEEHIEICLPCLNKAVKL